MKKFVCSKSANSVVKISFLFLFSHQLCTYSLVHSSENYPLREKRGVVFPPFTVLQFAVGLAVPAQVPNRTIFTNLGTLSNIPLPSKINQLYPYKGKGRQLTHNYFFELIKTILNWHDLNGEECVLKTICQVSRMNMNQNELIFDVLQLLFSPSAMKSPVAKVHYMMAEQTGKLSNRTCSETYPSCTHSIIDALIEEI